jgi:hypothetical protein
MTGVFMRIERHQGLQMQRNCPYEEAKGWPCSSQGKASEESSPTGFLVSDFQLPELWGNKFLLFKPMFCGIWYGNPSKLVHWELQDFWLSYWVNWGAIWGLWQALWESRKTNEKVLHRGKTEWNIAKMQSKNCPLNLPKATTIRAVLVGLPD